MKIPQYGFTVDPPVYPTRVRRTPGRLPNRESGPRNQPKAKVAVSASRRIPFGETLSEEARERIRESLKNP